MGARSCFVRAGRHARVHLQRDWFGIDLGWCAQYAYCCVNTRLSAQVRSMMGAMQQNLTAAVKSLGAVQRNLSSVGKTLDTVVTPGSSIVYAKDGSFVGIVTDHVYLGNFRHNGGKSAAWREAFAAARVTTIQGHLYIQECGDVGGAKSCDDLSFLNDLEVVLGGVYMTNNYKGLTTLNGNFKSLKAVLGEVEIHEHAICDVDAGFAKAFPKIVTIGGRLDVWLTTDSLCPGNTRQKINAMQVDLCNKLGLPRMCPAVRNGGGSYHHRGFRESACCCPGKHAKCHDCGCAG